MEENNEIKELYVFDINKMAEFVFNEQKTNGQNVEITESFSIDNDGTLKLTNKTVKETRNPNDNTINTIKYDLLKMFIQTLIDMPSPSSLEEDETSFGEKIIVNTMVNEEFLKLVKTNE